MRGVGGAINDHSDGGEHYATVDPDDLADAGAIRGTDRVAGSGREQSPG